MTRAKDTLPESGLLFIPAGEYDSLPPTVYIMEDVLPDNSVGMFSGSSGAGKTFAAIYTQVAIASGRSIFGLAIEQRNCLYVGLEGETAIKARIAACCDQLSLDASPLHYALGQFNLADEEDVAGLIAYMRKHRIGYVVIDTLSLAIAGLDEISGQAMTMVMEALHRIKRETGACVMAVAHLGKNPKAGVRGHSSQHGNADTVLEVVVHNVEKVSDGRKTREIEHPVTLATPRSIVVRKQRDGEGGKRLRFTLALRDTPFNDARGNPMRSPAVCEHEAFTDHGPEEEEAARLPSGVDTLALETLEALKWRERRLDTPLTRDTLRDELRRKGWRSDVEGPTWRQAFGRLFNKLKESGLWGATIQ